MAWSGIPLEAGLAKLPQGHQLSSVIHYTRLGRYHRAISSHQSFTTQGWEGTTGPSALISHSLHKAGKVPQGHQLSSVIHYTRLGRYHRAISSHQSFTTQGWEGTTGPSALWELRQCI